MFHQKIISLFSVLLLASSALAAKIEEVRFEQAGTLPLPPGMMLSLVSVRKGMEFSRKALDTDVRRLYETGNFVDVASEVLEQPDKNVKILFKVRLKPRITTIRFKGNVKYSTKDLQPLIKISEGSLLRDRDFLESSVKLREFYRSKGFNDVEISPLQIPEDKEHVAIVFNIKEHLKKRVHDVTFEGAELFSQWDLRHSIATQYSYWNWLPFVNDFLNRGLFDQRELELDRARLREKYHAKGYLDFTIRDVSFTQSKKDPEFYDIVFKVSEGKPYRTGKVEIVGNSVYKPADLLPAVALKSGGTFSSEAENATIRGITQLYEMLGYADISCQAQRTANFEKHTVDVKFIISEGRKYTVRDVIINGNISTKDKVLRRELVIAPGDPADRGRIDVSRRRLLGMGYFSKVEATAVGADALNEKNVIFKVEENPEKYHLRLGAGASDVNSFFGMAEISTNNFDIANPKNWFYGGGQRFRIQGIFGIDNAGFNVNFVEPWLFDIPLRFELSGYMNKTCYDDWDETRAGVKTSFGHKIFDDFTTLTIGYKFEFVKMSAMDRAVDNYVSARDQDGWQRLSQPSLSIMRDTRNSLMEPTAGYNIGFFGSITPEWLGSSDSFYRIELKGSYYYSFFNEAIVTMVGGKIGFQDGFNGDSDSVPVFEKYFLGGSGSLRGFDYHSVSPTVGHNRNVGGNTMLQLTAEVTHPIWGPLRGVVFVDAGNVWTNAYELGKLNVGVGYGFRMKIPQLNTPLEIDLAYPVVNNQDGQGDKLRVHFNVGMGLNF